MTLQGVRILLVTRDPSVHDAIRTLCSQIAPTFRGLEWAGSFRAALTTLDEGSVDVCILDAGLLNGTGVSLLQEPSVHDERIPVVLLLDAPPPPDEDPLDRPGVADWIVKDGLDVAPLQRALRHAARGRDAALARSRKRQAREELLLRLADALSGTRTLNDALRVATDEMVRHLGWDVGHVYVRDDAELRPTRIWLPAASAGYPELRRVTERTHVAPGEGLVGRAFADRRPAWSSDVTADPTFARKEPGLGIRAALAVPVLGDGEVAAVLEFFSADAHAPDPGVLETADRVSALLSPIACRQRVLDALRSSYDLLNAMVEGVPDALFVKDTEGRYVMMNGAAAAEAGRPLMGAIGRCDVELFEPETAAALRRQDREVVESGEQVTFEETLESPAGIRRAYRITKGPVRNGRGRIVGVYGIARNVTEPRRRERTLQAENRELRSRARLLETLVGVGTTLRAPGLPLEQRLERIAGLVCQEGVLASRPVEARIVLHGKEFRTGEFGACTDAHRVTIRSESGDVGLLEVASPASAPDEEDDETRMAELLDRIARELGTLPATSDDPAK